MARRTINECDRCHREIKTAVAKLALGSRTMDLCASCERQVERLLDGESVCDCEPPLEVVRFLP